MSPISPQGPFFNEMCFFEWNGSKWTIAGSNQPTIPSFYVHTASFGPEPFLPIANPIHRLST